MPLFNSLEEAQKFSLKIAEIQTQATVWHQGYLRYEALRKCNPNDFLELWKQTLLGHRFDDLVDKLVLYYQTPVAERGLKPDVQEEVAPDTLPDPEVLVRQPFRKPKKIDDE